MVRRPVDGGRRRDVEPVGPRILPSSIEQLASSAMMRAVDDADTGIGGEGRKEGAVGLVDHLKHALETLERLKAEEEEWRLFSRMVSYKRNGKPGKMDAVLMKKSDVVAIEYMDWGEGATLEQVKEHLQGVLEATTTEPAYLDDGMTSEERAHDPTWRRIYGMDEEEDSE